MSVQNETELAQVFRALGEPVRLRLFHALSCCDELCVCHLTEALQLPQSTISRHLAVLRQAGMVTAWREGKWMHYRLGSAMARELARIVQAQGGSEVLSADATRLLRVHGGCKEKSG
ncbi:MAG: transcriptional regulator [Zetaproteobacteria bacterium]|nr:MAG: transcriptional regulator [Zetaproteobacteria bacterium]